MKDRRFGPELRSTGHSEWGRLLAGAALFAALALPGLRAAPSLQAPPPVESPDWRTADWPPQPGPPEAGILDSASLDSLLRPLLIDRMTDRYIAGAAIAVVHDGRIVYRGGFGDREVYSEDPVEPESTIFRIGSVTKVLTGIAVLQLVDRGLVDLDANVNVYLDPPLVPDTFEAPVRVRHLLTHTAGFDQIGLDRHAPSREAVRPLEEFLAEYLVRIRPPGVMSTYDTYGITLAGHLVEEVTGLSYEEYLRRHIFEPLGMTRSGITVPSDLQEDVAVGYGFAGSWESEAWEFMNTDPASTVNATVTDMGRLAAMLLQEGTLDGRRVLTRASARAMLTRQFTNHPDQPGYSFTLFEDWDHGVPAFGHGGSMAGYAAHLYLVPEGDVGVFVAYNQESGGLAAAAIDRVVGALWPARPEHRPLREHREGVDLSRFTGTWANSLHHHGNPETGWRRRPFTLESSGANALLFQDETAHAVGPLTFQAEDGLLLNFREGREGEVTHLFVKQTVYERLQ